MASVYPRTIKKENGKIYKMYYVKWIEDGKEKRMSTGQKTKAGANLFLRNFKPNSNPRIDLKALEKEVMTTIGVTCKSKTILLFKTTLKLFIETVGNKPLEQVTKNNILTFRKARTAAVKKNGELFKNNSINLEIGALKRAFNISIDNDWIQKNPCRGIKPLPVSITRRPFTENEIKLLMQELSKCRNIGKYYAMIIIFNCGLRNNEGCSLKWSQIHLDNWTIKLTNKMTGLDEWVGFNQTVYDVFMELQKNPVKSLDGSIYGEPFDSRSLYQTVFLILKRLNLPPGLCVHSARHTAITRWVNKLGIHLGQKMARHKSIAMTEKYYHAKDEEIRKAAKEIQVT